MLRFALITWVIGIGSAWIGSANPVPEKPTDDLGALQGNWKPLQCEFQGVPQMPADVMKQTTVVFDKNEYYLYFVDRSKVGDPKVLRLALLDIALDEKTTPKSITFEFKEGPLKGEKRHGIYELAGNQLKLCYCPIDKVKPAKFASPAGSGHFLETWARQPK